MAQTLSEGNLNRVNDLKKRYQQPQAVLLEALWLWQEQYGWISQEGMNEIASIVNVPPHEVYGVVTFYTMFNTKPVGRHKLEVCTNISCMLRNCDSILNHIGAKLNIGVGETTPDSRFTLVEAECLGSCGTAPMMQVGDDYYEDLDQERVDKILEDLK